MEQEIPEQVASEAAEFSNRPDKKEAMRGVITNLKAKNEQLGGELFNVFGNNSTNISEILMFNNPTKVEVDTPGGRKTVNHFLVVTEDGFKIIEIDNDATEERNDILDKFRRGSFQSDYSTGWSSQQGNERIEIGEFVIQPFRGHRDGVSGSINNRQSSSIRLIVDLPNQDEAVEIISSKLKEVTEKKDAEERVKQEEDRKAQAQIQIAESVNNLLT